MAECINPAQQIKRMEKEKSCGAQARQNMVLLHEPISKIPNGCKAIDCHVYMLLLVFFISEANRCKATAAGVQTIIIFVVEVQKAEFAIYTWNHRSPP